ncbi:hypothetical protein QOZ80_1BG0080350 [Eleusine coracana subsp. coracana]|nr:hypothetical protein QOZ80_1BG0080350 [Eleusine coracana subsp. coracana]
MATLRSSWLSTAAVAATSHRGSAWPIRVAMPVQPLCCRNLLPAPVRMQARIHCQKSADNYPAPEPEPEPELDDYRPEVMLGLDPGKLFVDLIPGNSDDPCMQELRKYHEAYCAATGMDLTDIASLDVGTTEFSQHTLNQMVRTYAPIFRNAAEDAYRKRIKRNTVLSFLDALRGLVTICRALVQDTVAMLEDCHPSKNSITEEMARPSREYDRKEKNLKQEFITATFERTVPNIFLAFRHSVVSLLSY